MLFLTRVETMELYIFNITQIVYVIVTFKSIICRYFRAHSFQNKKFCQMFLEISPLC